MKKIIKFSIVIVFLVLFSVHLKFAGGQLQEKKNNSVEVVPQSEVLLPQNVFAEGERIKFGVYSAGVKVGSGELYYKGATSLNGQKAQNVIFKVSTFSVNDEDVVFGSLDFSAPLKVDRKIRIFGKDEVISETYSPDRKSLVISKSIDGKKSEISTISTEEELSNVLLLLYKLRNVKDLSKGKNYKITLPTQNFDLIVKDSRKIKTHLGLFDAIYLESTPPKYRIWLSPEPEHLPLRIQGLVAGGMLYLVATEVIN